MEMGAVRAEEWRGAGLQRTYIPANSRERKADMAGGGCCGGCGDRPARGTVARSHSLSVAAACTGRGRRIPRSEAGRVSWRRPSYRPRFIPVGPTQHISMIPNFQE